MKMHAKKNLTIPIAVLLSFVAIIFGYYTGQVFSAYAEEQIDFQSVEYKVPTENDTLTANIHLSTGDIFTGSISNTGESGPWDPFFAWTGNKIINYNDQVDNFTVTKTISESLETTRITIFAKKGFLPANQVCKIDLDNTFYEYVDFTVNFRLVDNTVDISINVTPKYYICFNANGGQFIDGQQTQWIAQGKYNKLQFPSPQPTASETKYFTGWYTHPVWGERITDDIQAKGLDGVYMLYAHWSNPEEPINLSFSADQFSGLFNYTLIKYEGQDISVDNNTVGYYTLDKDIAPKLSQFSPSLGLPTAIWGIRPALDSDDKVSFYMSWDDIDSSIEYLLTITAIDGQRISGLTLNGASINMRETLSSAFYTETPSLFNNFVISTEWAISSFVAVSSSDGQLFKCNVKNNNGDSDEFLTDYLPIFVKSDEYIFYSYGGYLPDMLTSLGIENDFIDSGNPGMVILVTNFTGNMRVYKFSDNLISLFDWFDLSSHIIGVNTDGTDIPIGNYEYQLSSGFHSIALKMSGHEADTTVTYNANGGAFAEGETSVTLDATYGEALPAVANPTLAENDFVGWFTEAEGGVQVDPANYQWKPWDRWNGVTLYAHWAYNPQPVPPEPVPPEPGPTPVDPDNPGGVGTAQTGDSMPLVPFVALAVIAVLGCALTLRKEYSN